MGIGIGILTKYGRGDRMISGCVRFMIGIGMNRGNGIGKIFFFHMNACDEGMNDAINIATIAMLFKLMTFIFYF